jgi:DNA-binding NarL/FixJ family response regulator
MRLETINIVIADDHPIVRQGLRKTIEIDPSLRIIAESGDGKGALEQIRELQPEIAILDINMPEMGGIDVARRVQEQKLRVGIVLLTIYREEEFFQEALNIGVKGYLLKDSMTIDIIAGIKAVAEGRHYISSSLSPYLINRCNRATCLPEEKSPIDNLTPMERRVLKLIAEEKTSKQIAESLFISPRTVETHRTNICRKLELRGSLALIKFALSHKSALLSGPGAVT